MRLEEVLALEGVDSETVNIMMLGFVQSGKSSTINSIFSILDGRISNRAKVGVCSLSFTQKYSSYQLENELKRIFLFDTMGFELRKDLGIQNDEIINCLRGEVEEGYQFNPCSSLHRSNENFYNSKLRKQREIHCVIHCVDAKLIFEEIVPELGKKIKEIESELTIAGHDRIVLVTNIDDICSFTKKNITEIFYNKDVQEVVEIAASVCRVNVNHVFPIKNYVDEMEIDEFKNIPLLLALKNAVEIGANYLRDKADQARRLSEPAKVLEEIEAEKTNLSFDTSKSLEEIGADIFFEYLSLNIL